MKVWTTVISRWDETLQRYVTVEEESSWFEYEGEVALCKGDNTAKQTEALQAQNMQNQMAQNAQLMSIFQTQFDKQNSILQYVQGKMQPIIDNPQGYSPEALAAMRTNATDTVSNQYNNAQKAIQQSSFTHGGRDLPSGVDAQLNSALLAQEASDKAGTNNNITLQNENLKQANYWNALNTLSGVGAQFNPQSYAGLANGAANTAVGAGNSVANLSQAVTQSQQSGVMGMLGGLAGGVFGAAGQAGGFGKLFGSGAPPSCHAAAATFGEPADLTGIKTFLVRYWLQNVWSRNWYAKPVLWFYNRTSLWISKNKYAMVVAAPLFRKALSQVLAQEVR